jgi:hypothetical protein
MALINCPDCGKQISDQAKTCPSCARPIKHRASISPGLKTILFIVGIIAVIGIGSVLLLGSAMRQREVMAKRERETAVIQTLETLRKVQALYALDNKQYGTFDQLRASGALEDARFSGNRPVVDGYIFTMQVKGIAPGRPAFYSINADPAEDSSGSHFYLDPNINATRVHESRPATADDPSIAD